MVWVGLHTIKTRSVSVMRRSLSRFTKSASLSSVAPTPSSSHTATEQHQQQWDVQQQETGSASTPEAAAAGSDEAQSPVVEDTHSPPPEARRRRRSSSGGNHKHILDPTYDGAKSSPVPSSSLSGYTSSPRTRRLMQMDHTVLRRLSFLIGAIILGALVLDVGYIVFNYLFLTAPFWVM